MKTLAACSLGFLVVFGSATNSQAQSLLASSTVSGVPDPGVSGSYEYTLTLTALTGSVPIESFWFAWTPGDFYLSSTPSGITGADGWMGSAFSHSIQFVEGSAITAGTSDTFNFVSTDTPTEMANEVGSLHSVAYSGGIESAGPSDTIGVQAVPEPSALSLIGVSALGLAGYFWRKRHALP